jgi:hypothetical protein
MESGPEHHGDDPTDDCVERLSPESLTMLPAATLLKHIEVLHDGTVKPPADTDIETLRAIVASTLNGEY